MTKYTFSVTGMHCTSCRLLIDETLEDLPGITGSETSVRAGRTVVDIDDTLCTPAQVAAAITAAGYPAHLETP